MKTMKLMILLLAIASISLFAMEQPSPSDLPRSSEVLAWKIQIREALRRGKLKRASALIESRRLHPGAEVIKFIRDNDLGIPMGLAAVENKHGLTLKFLVAEQLIKPGIIRNQIVLDLKKYQSRNRAANTPQLINELRQYLTLALALNLKNEIIRLTSEQERGEALINAVRDTDPLLIELLIELGADVNYRNPLNERSPLLKAIYELTSGPVELRARVIETIETLLNAHANPNLQSKSGRTPLMYLLAVYTPAYEPVIWLFLSHGVDLAIKDKKGDTALDRLGNNPEEATAKEILQEAAEQQRNAPKQVATTGPSDLPRGREVLAWKIQIREALRRGKLKRASALIESRRLHPGAAAVEFIRNNNLGTQMAFMAAENNHDLMVKFLESEDLIDLEAVRAGFEDTRNLYQQTKPIGEQRLIAAQLLRYLKLRSKIKQKDIIDLNSKGRAGITLLSEAANDLIPELINALVSQGADVNIQDEMGYSPLANATVRIYYPVENPISIRLQTMQIILAAHANPNIQTNDGETPLILLAKAVKNGIFSPGDPYHGTTEDIEKAVQLLLQYGADPNIKNKDGKAALDYVQGQDNHFSNTRAMLQAASEQKVIKPEPQNVNK